MANPFTAELEITPAPSRLLLLFIACIHLLAGVVVGVLPGLDSGWRFFLLSAVLLSAGYYGYWHSGLWAQSRVKTRIKKLYWREFGGWELLTDSGQQVPVILRTNSFSHRYGSILNFNTRKALGGKHYTVILLIDNCDQEIRRRLHRRIKLLQLAGK